MRKMRRQDETQTGNVRLWHQVFFRNFSCCVWLMHKLMFCYSLNWTPENFSSLWPSINQKTAITTLTASWINKVMATCLCFQSISGWKWTLKKFRIILKTSQHQLYWKLALEFQHENQKSEFKKHFFFLFCQHFIIFMSHNAIQNLK